MAQENNDEIIEAIQGFANHVDQRFDAVDKRMDKMDQRMDKTDQRMDKIDQSIGRLRSDVIDNVERVVNNAKGDIIAVINRRHEQYRIAFEKIFEILQRNNLADSDEVKALHKLIV